MVNNLMCFDISI